MQRLPLLPPLVRAERSHAAVVNGGDSSTHTSSTHSTSTSTTSTSTTSTSTSTTTGGGGGGLFIDGRNEADSVVGSDRGCSGGTAELTSKIALRAAAMPTALKPLLRGPTESAYATAAPSLSAERRTLAPLGAEVDGLSAATAAAAAAAAAATTASPVFTVQRSLLPRRRLTGGVYGASVVVERPLRPHELRLAQLVERLVQAANGRLAEGFGSRELSSFVWSLVALGYWQPPLVPLVAAFADYGAERLRAADPIAMAIVLQVLAKARAAAAAGQTTATKLSELVPATAAAAATSLPRCLPSCDPRTLAGLLHSCTVLLSPSPNSSCSSLRGGIEASGTPFLEGSTGSDATPATKSGSRHESGSESGSRQSGSEMHLDGRTTEALAAVAREVTKECVRRRFIGFGPVSLVTAAGALTALCRSPNPVLGGGDDSSAVWAILAAAAVSPTAPQMAGATPQQWTMLLRAARAQGGPSQQMLLTGAAAAGVSVS
ncbi:hypothetical protein Vafri_10311 [Volvox africanus]|nr:hypothetical protein Vafri_10311 [Volvox africanus]